MYVLTYCEIFIDNDYMLCEWIFFRVNWNNNEGNRKRNVYIIKNLKVFYKLRSRIAFVWLYIAKICTHSYTQIE